MPRVKKYKKGSDIKLSKNFHLSEWDCSCSDPECQWTIVATEHVKYLQKKRDEWKKSIKINSAYRCEKYNQAVGGASLSRHKEGDATDITVKGLDPSQVADLCEDANGLGRYDTFTHVDSRPQKEGKKSRWDFRKKK